MTQKAPPFPQGIPGQVLQPGEKPERIRTQTDIENDEVVRGMREGVAFVGGVMLGNKAPAELAGAGNVGKPTLAPGENPFKKKEEVKPVEQPEVITAPEGTPAWGDFVKFVMKNGDHIMRVEYPNPPRNADLEEFFKGKPRANEQPWNVIDTQWKGIPVFQGGAARIMHDVYGWASWEDCQS